MNKDLNISLNANHIIVFLEFFDRINILLEQLNKDEANKKNKQIIESNDDIDIRKAKNEEIIENKKKNEEKQRLKQSEIKTNISDFHDFITYELGISNISLQFFDIIDGLYQSLFEFSMTNTKLELLQNSNPKDSANVMNYLINTFKNEKKELNTYDKENFYMYCNLLTNIEIRTLNTYLNQWESFVEPFQVNLYYCQFLKRMRPNVELTIPNMLNINLSLNFAKILSYTLNKISMNKEEVQKNKEETIIKKEMNPDYQHSLHKESPTLIIENYTGVDIEIWFDNIKYDNSNKDLIIKIKSDQRFEFTNTVLKKYKIEKINNNLNSTLSYKFCLNEKIVNNNNININNLVGHYFNINYHHMDIHDIND
jgi:hypothetical protein